MARWSELGALGPLLAVPPDHLTEETLPAEVHRLRAADPDGRLVATVRAYLDEAGNGPAAAARLHIHRTSLYYRLDRVTRLTGLDVSDGATRLALHLGLTALDVIEAGLAFDSRSTERPDHSSGGGGDRSHSAPDSPRTRGGHRCPPSPPPTA
ncbi:CdaR family transcriptional regulator [Pseudonocardia sp. ICBG601]|uniref:PucR family transcriptional regulator n=1 Tax=Pseudonocardia sp. ICBG601 TaxID=2846759 RepID=UPI001CF644B5|nr:helix-turn-helix domain-containing protein [Pseudonocardia sp. ICBG601]